MRTYLVRRNLSAIEELTKMSPTHFKLLSSFVRSQLFTVTKEMNILSAAH